MKTTRILGATFAAATLLLGAFSAYSAEKKTEWEVKYPDGFRHWNHVRTMTIEEGHPLFHDFGGIHHIYVNDKGINAMKEGKPYPDGTVLVFDLWAEAKGQDHTISDGAHKGVGVMERNTKAFSATNGWGYELFKGDSKTERAVTDGGKGCSGCHDNQAGKTHSVFSAWHE